MLRLPGCHAFSCCAFVSADIFVTTGCRTAFQGSNQASGCSRRAALSRAARALDLPLPAPCAPTRHYTGARAKFPATGGIEACIFPIMLWAVKNRHGADDRGSVVIVNCPVAHLPGPHSEVLGCVWAQRRRGMVRSPALEMEFADQKVPVLSVSIGYGIHRCGYLADGGGVVHTSHGIHTCARLSAVDDATG